MSTLAIESPPRAQAVRCTETELEVGLSDGRTICVPIIWFPRLAGATRSQREHYELLGDGQGIHWPEADEDISVAGLLAGNPSVEPLPAN